MIEKFHTYKDYPLMGAIFLAIASVVYILFRSWSNKLYFEKWKDYEDCGI